MAFEAWLHQSLHRLGRALMPNDWPAELARALGLPADVRVVREAIALPQPPGSAPYLRVGFASDFHAGPTTQAALIEAAARALREAAIDVLLLGGDFVSFHPHHLARVLEPFADVTAPAGRFAVLGNHDHAAGAGPIRRALESAGIVVLHNRAVRLSAPFKHTWVCGLDDHLLGEPDGARALAGADGVRIVLMHQPSGLLDLAGARFEVALCGHTHGGQVALPGGTPLLLPRGRLSRSMARGRHDLPGGGSVLVSNGVGCAALPLRWNAPADVLVVECACDGGADAAARANGRSS